MARRKSADPSPENGTATAVFDPPPETTAVSAEAPPREQVPPEGNGHALTRPVKSIAVAAGDGVTIEGSIWPREITLGGKQLTAYTATVRKAYRGEDDAVRHTGVFRGAEIPLVQYVLGCCAQWMLDQRREEDPPF